MENREIKTSMDNIESIDIRKYPITTNAFTWSPLSIFLYVLLNILSFMIPSVMILTFFNNALNSNITANWWRMLFFFC